MDNCRPEFSQSQKSDIVIDTNSYLTDTDPRRLSDPRTISSSMSRSDRQ